MPVPRKYCEVRCMKRSKAQNKRRREGIPAKRAGGGGSKKGNTGPRKKRDGNGKGPGSGSAGAVLGGRPSLLEQARSDLDNDELIAEDSVPGAFPFPEPGHFELAFDEWVSDEQDAPNTAVLPPSLSQLELQQPHLAVPQPHLAQHGHSNPTPREPDPDLFAAEEALAACRSRSSQVVYSYVSGFDWDCPGLFLWDLFPPGVFTAVKSLYDNRKKAAAEVKVV
ncbi:hypothetical protein B0T13DRAFT_506997 [Neurospora crassa]|nr:hypothetical protein B0T13DRAFT_506997 [Neurospora crassa]